MNLCDLLRSFSACGCPALLAARTVLRRTGRWFDGRVTRQDFGSAALF